MQLFLLSPARPAPTATAGGRGGVTPPSVGAGNPAPTASLMPWNDPRAASATRDIRSKTSTATRVTACIPRWSTLTGTLAPSWRRPAATGENRAPRISRYGRRRRAGARGSEQDSQAGKHGVIGQHPLPRTGGGDSMNLVHQLRNSFPRTLMFTNCTKIIVTTDAANGKRFSENQPIKAKGKTQPPTRRRHRGTARPVGYAVVLSLYTAIVTAQGERPFRVRASPRCRRCPRRGP